MQPELQSRPRLQVRSTKEDSDIRLSYAGTLVGRLAWILGLEELHMSKWDLRFLELAELVGSWSKDPSTQVGAVIVDIDNRIVSTGFNGFPRGCLDHADTLGDRERKLLRTIHAEDNALLFARRDVTGMTMYVTRPPCARCAAKVVQAGIAKVVYRLPPTDFTERWQHEMTEAMAIYNEVLLPVVVLGDL